MGLIVVFAIVVVMFIGLVVVLVPFSVVDVVRFNDIDLVVNVDLEVFFGSTTVELRNVDETVGICDVDFIVISSVFVISGVVCAVADEVVGGKYPVVVTNIFGVDFEIVILLFGMDVGT